MTVYKKNRLKDLSVFTIIVLCFWLSLIDLGVINLDNDRYEYLTRTNPVSA